MKAYAAFFRIRFAASLQYRAAAVAGMVTQLAWGFMEILAFNAFYQANPASFPMEFSQTVSYLWMQQAFLALFMVWFYDNDIFAAISSGSIAYELVRPMELFNRWFTQNAATRLAKTLLRCLPILLIALLLPAPYKLVLPTNPVTYLLFVLSAILGLGVVLGFTMLVYISTFFTLNPTGVRITAAILADFLSGSVVPLPFFPPAVQRIATLLPFASMQNMPLRIFAGNITGSDAFWGILLQLAWLVLLLAAGKAWMAYALNKVVVQGG